MLTSSVNSFCNFLYDAIVHFWLSIISSACYSLWKWVWKYFGYKDKDAVKKKTALCWICCKAVGVCGGYKNLMPSSWNIPQWLEVKQMASHKYWSLIQLGQHKYDCNSRKWQQPTDAVVYCIRKDMLPYICIYYWKGTICKLTKQFDPQYKLPSWKYFSKTAIPWLYQYWSHAIVHDFTACEIITKT